MNERHARQPQEAQTSPTNPDGNGSQPTSHAIEILSAEAEQTSTPESAKAERIDHPSIQKSTGPRTAPGKKRSSQNALKSGIFSRATLLKGESPSDYQSLLEGLWETMEPQGKLEELLIEKLASISWRYQRLLIAEGAEIRKNSKFPEGISRGVQSEVRTGMSLDSEGLISRLYDPDVIERCLELLVELMKGIMARGLDKQKDGSLLRIIYGDPDRDHIRQTLQDKYLDWLETARTPEAERAREGYATPEQCQQNVIREIGGESLDLVLAQQKRNSIESERAKLDCLRGSIPDSQGLDRLLRYENSLERAFDRTLTQFERAQRARKGQPLPPKVEVNIS
jgi:hypothetical protein